jgi:hypothetical protein
MDELPDNSVSLGRVHPLLDALFLKDKTDASCAHNANARGEESGDHSGQEAEEAIKKALHRTQQMKTALQVTAAL